MKMSLRVEGFKELGDTLNALTDRFKSRVVLDILETAAEPMRSRMEALAPRGIDAPHLADNIVIQRGVRRLGRGISGEAPRSLQSGEFAVAVGPRPKFFYGLFLEYGTIKMSAQPFARPAFVLEAPTALELIRTGAWTRLAESGIGRSRTIEAPIGGEGRLL